MSNTNSTDHQFKVGDFVKVTDVAHSQYGRVGTVTSVSSLLVSIDMIVYPYTTVRPSKYITARPSNLELLHRDTDPETLVYTHTI